MVRETCVFCKKGVNSRGKAGGQCLRCKEWMHRSCIIPKNVSDSEDILCHNCKSDQEEVRLPDDSVEVPVTVTTSVIQDLIRKVNKLETEMQKVSQLEAEVAKLQSLLDELANGDQHNVQVPANEQEPVGRSLSYNAIHMKQGNILEGGEDMKYSIAHCVGQDLLMSDGIAEHIKKKFNTNVEELRLNSRVGEVLVQEHGENYILHMVTKLESTGKPHWKTFKKTIYNLEKKCSELGISELVMPKIGCGLDGQDWGRTMKVIKYAFANSNVKVTVMYLSDEDETKYRAGIKNKRLKNTSPKTIPRIEVIGDSQVRDISGVMKQLNEEAKIYVSATSGATTKKIAEDINAQVAHLTPSDAVFIMSGTNDIKIQQDGTVTTDLYRVERECMLSQSKHLNMFIIAVPHRFDKEVINPHVDNYNNWLEELCRKNNIPFININDALSREDFTNHGLHLNGKGKEKLSSIITYHASKVLKHQNFN